MYKFIILFLALVGTSLAQAPPTTVILAPETFSSTHYGELQQLANKVALAVDDLIPGRMSEFVKGDITCFQVTKPTLITSTAFSSPPVTLSMDYKLPYEPASTVSGRTRIALFEVEPPYAQSYRERFVYQLAHELAHVKMGVRIDNYLVETFAVAVSYEVLVRLGMIGYANLEFNNQMHQLPQEIQLAYTTHDVAAVQRYWQGRIPTQKSIDDRPFQSIGAALIRFNPVPWSALLGIAFDTDCPLNNPPINMRVCTPNLKKMIGVGSILASLGFSSVS